MVAEGNVGLAFALVLAAGASSAIGALLVFLINAANYMYLAASLGFAAGLMLLISLVEMLPRQSVTGFEDDGHSEDASIRFSILCFFAGLLLTATLDRLFHFFAPSAKRGPLLAASKSWAALRSLTLRSGRSMQKRRRTQEAAPECIQEEECSPDEEPNGDTAEGRGDEQLPQVPPPPPLHDIEAPPPLPPAAAQAGQSKTIEKSVEEINTDCLSRRRNTKLGRMAFLVAVSLAVHNLFEGIAVFVGTLHEARFGAAIAFAIALHNVPESICIAFPIYFATGSRSRAVLWTLVPSLAEPLGGLIAYLSISSQPSDLLFGIVFGIISGIMTYISVQELLPTAFKYDPENKVATKAMLGGIVLMAGSLMLLTL